MKTRNSHNLTMVFDTETTGLPAKTKEESPKKIHRELKSIFDFNVEEQYPPIQYNKIESLESQPYITQLSFVVVNDQYDIVYSYNHYIKISAEVEIPEIVTQITGITHEMCDGGVECLEALTAFISWFLKCDRIVAHNIKFDSHMIRVEMARHKEELMNTFPYFGIVFNTCYNRVSRLDQYDTMMRTIKICGLWIPKNTEQGMKRKAPKLQEMYQIFFHKTPPSLHNSMVDVLATLRCYLKVSTKDHRDIDDGYFDELIQKAIHNGDIRGHLPEFV